MYYDSFIYLYALVRTHVQGIAGNIVPAISTTNAIVAGIQVLQAIKIITSPSKVLHILACTIAVDKCFVFL